MRLSYRTVVRKRTEFLFFAFAVAYAALALRLTYLQFWNAERYEEFGQKIRDRRRTIPAERGVICDRLGRVLAINVTASSVYANPNRVERPEQVSFRLAAMVDCDPDLVAQKLNLDKEFVWIRRGASDQTGVSIEKAGLRGVGVIKEQKRLYPCGAAAQVVGFTDIDGKGLEGIERSAERYLKGSDGLVVAEVDRSGRVIPETRRRVVKPHDGKDVVLTIDAYIQNAVEEALEEAFVTSRATSAVAIVLDPATGEILALANRPTFSPNNRTGMNPDCWRNRCITDLYEPGSTLKAITAAAALNEGVVDQDDVFASCSGALQVGRRRIRCVLHRPYEHGHGAVDLRKMITYSCNVGASELGMRLGPDRLYRYARDFGLLSAPGLGLVRDRRNNLQKPSRWPRIKTANVAFGQGIAITPLQLACAYGAIANGGVLMRPMIVKEIRNKDGTVYKSYESRMVRRVISESTAEQLTRALVSCVKDGTGKPGGVEGYMVAGKTGSAQKVRPGQTRYSAFVASFVGFAPASDPKMVILVVIDEPKGTHWGATVAAPAFRKIAQKSMWYLRTPRDAPPTRPNTRVAERYTLARLPGE